MLLTVAAVLASSGLVQAEPAKHFADDSLCGTLARDHDGRAVYFEGKHRRTYVAYMDDKFDAHVKADDTVQRDLLTRTARIEASTAHMQADLTEIKAILRASNTPE